MAAWGKYRAKKEAFDDFIEEANLEGWIKGKKETVKGLENYKEMAAAIDSDIQKEIKLSKEARKIVGASGETKKEEDKGDSKDEQWAFNMPIHVVNATKGPSENVTTAKITAFPAI